MEMRNLLKDVSLGNKVTTLVAQRDFLNRLIKMKEATPEIVKLASDVMRNSERSRLWERRIMNQRRFLKDSEIVEIRKQWQMASRLVESRLPAHKVTEYRWIKRSELNYLWQKERLHKDRIILKYQCP